MLNIDGKKVHIRRTVALIVISDLEITQWAVELVCIEFLLGASIEADTEHTGLVPNFVRECLANRDVSDLRDAPIRILWNCRTQLSPFNMAKGARM